MNIAKIKQEISLSDYLSKIGAEPKRKYKEYWLYNSPLRPDKKPSFTVNLETNRFFDFGSGQSGDLIDFVKLYNGMDTNAAIQLLSGNTPNCEMKPETFSFSWQKDYALKKKNDNPAIEILKVKPLNNKLLLNYLKQRCIPETLAKKYCQEIYFRTTASEKTNFGVAFANVSGGFAVRNQFQKLAVSPVNFSLIKGQLGREVNIFEGFLDFLSAMVYLDVEKLKYDSIILNSTVNEHKAREIYRTYPQLNLFLDNDPTGIQTAATIAEINPNIKIYSQIIFPDSKDFNEYLRTKSKV